MLVGVIMPSFARRRPLRIYILPAAALLILIQSFPLLAPIILSLILILLLSMAAHPLVTRLRLLTGRRAVAAALLATAFFLGVILLGWAFFRPVKNSAGKVTERLPTYWEQFQRPLIKLEQQARLADQKLRAEVASETGKKDEDDATDPAGRAFQAPAPKAAPDPSPDAKDSGNFIRSGLSQVLQGAAGRFTALAFNAAQIIIVLVTVFFGVTFTLMNPRPVFGAVLGVVPEVHHDKAVLIMRRVAEFMPKWALATLMAMVTVGVLVFLLMWPIFGFFDALVLGLIAGVLEAIPYIGPTLSAVPALMFALAAGGSTPVWVVAIYVGVQFLENNLIAPLVMAGGMKLHPLAVMIAMLLCVAAFGVLGLIAAAPLVAVAGILHEELYRKRFLPNTTPDELELMTRRVFQDRPAAK